MAFTEESMGARNAEAVAVRQDVVATLKSILADRIEAAVKEAEYMEAETKRQQEESARLQAEAAERKRLQDIEDEKRRVREAELEAEQRLLLEKHQAERAALTRMESIAPELVDSLETMVDLVAKLLQRINESFTSQGINPIHQSELDEVKHAKLLINRAKGIE